jgi:galactonate dehydratase
MRVVELTTVRTPLQPNVCLVRLLTDDGTIGIGEAFWGADAVEAYLHEAAAPVLAGLDDLAPAAVATALRPYVGFSGSGAEVRGNGAIDLALWDLLGQVSGQPVVRLLGGPLTPLLRVYNTCAGYDYIKQASRQLSSSWGLPESGERPYEDLAGFLERPAELTRSLLGEGYTAMKVWPFDRAAEASRGHRIAAAELRSGMAVLEAIRAEAGDQMDVMVELHSLWSLKAATEILHAMADIAPYWVEDPIRTDAIDGYRRLRERARVPIAAGEAMSGTRGFKPLLDAAHWTSRSWTSAGPAASARRSGSRRWPRPTGCPSRRTTAPARSRSRSACTSPRRSRAACSPRPSARSSTAGTRSSSTVSRRSRTAP